MKIYVTERVLTKGILEFEVDSAPSDDIVILGKGDNHAFVHKPYWHTNKAKALKHAKEMIADKLEEMEAEMTRLELNKDSYLKIRQVKL